MNKRIRKKHKAREPKHIRCAICRRQLPVYGVVVSDNSDGTADKEYSVFCERCNAITRLEVIGVKVKVYG